MPRMEPPERFRPMLRAGSAHWPMTVCWADFLARGPHAGRGVVMVGRWAERGEAVSSVRAGSEEKLEMKGISRRLS